MQRVNMGDHLGFTGPACLALQYPLCRLITDPGDGLRQIQPPVTCVVFEQFRIAPPVNGRRQLPLGLFVREVFVQEVEEEVDVHQPVSLLASSVKSREKPSAMNMRSVERPA
jgi:hypothetical protein